MKSIALFDLKPNIDIIKRVNVNPIPLLNASVLLQIGNKIATIVHIKSLLNSVNKEYHGLVQSDIYPEDRQNFKSLEKIMDDRVIQALESHVPDCEQQLHISSCASK